MSEPRKVAAAAIRNIDTGEVFSVPQPGRHNHVIALIGAAFKEMNYDMGFVLSDGRWATRKEAVNVAIQSGQITEAKWPAHGLFSEDLW